MSQPNERTTEAPASAGAGEAQPNGADLVGTVLAGRYRILQKLGEGAMGAVYLGEHLKIGRRDAIKVLRGPLMADAEAVARFNRGARNVAAVQHTNVCTIYDYSDTDDGTPFLAMEFVAGESLKELLDQEGFLPLERAVRIARQTAEALQAAHEAGIVHRDLKPANIMLMQGRDGADEVRVVDFDIAKGSQDGEESEVTRLGFVIGTPEYMSPEQLMAERLDGRSDVYSLGIVLFRMLTGSLPFQAPNAQEMMFQRLTGQPLRLDEVRPDLRFPPGLQEVLDRALQRKASDRFASAAECARALVEAANNAVPVQPGNVALSATGIFHAPLAERRSGVEEVPQTRLAPVPEQVTPGSGGQATADAKPVRRQGRSNRLIGMGSASVVLAVGMGWFLLNGAADADLPPGSQPLIQTALSESVAPAGPEVLAQPALPSVEVPSTVAADPPASPPSVPRTGTQTAAQPASPTAQPGRGQTDRGEPETLYSAGGAPETDGAMTVPQAQAALRRLVQRLAQPNQSGRDLTMIRDTAMTLLDFRGLSTNEQARAAHIAASTWYLQGNRERCASLVGRALALNPGNSGYQQLEARCNEGSSP